MEYSVLRIVVCHLMALLVILTGSYGNTTELEATETGLREYCDRESFTADCGDRGVVVMDYAEYGRMKLGRCLKNAFGHIGCGENILKHMDSVCSGRHKCHIPDVVDELHTYNPCSVDDLKVYMQAAFHCVNVPAREELCSQEKLIHVSHDGTSLASRHLNTPSCLGDEDWHTFYIKALPGQQINISLVDFGTLPPGNRHFCAEYGEIEDEGTKQVILICGGSQRDKWLTLSNSHKVQIRLSKQAIQKENFVITMQALGCPDLEPPPLAWVEREADAAIIGCHTSRQQWHLTCEGHKWVGGVGNCSNEGFAAASIMGKGYKIGLTTKDMTVAFISSVATVAAIAIITTGAILWRKYSVENQLRRMNQNQDVEAGKGTLDTKCSPDSKDSKQHHKKSGTAKTCSELSGTRSHRHSNGKTHRGKGYMSPVSQHTKKKGTYDFCFAAPGVQGENPFMDKALPSIPDVANNQNAQTPTMKKSSIQNKKLPLLPEQEKQMGVMCNNENDEVYQVPTHISEHAPAIPVKQATLVRKPYVPNIEVLPPHDATLLINKQNDLNNTPSVHKSKRSNRSSRSPPKTSV